MLMQVSYIPMTAAECEHLKKIVAEQNWASTFRWGTFGADGTDSLRWLPLRELSTEHIENIIMTQPQVPPAYRAAMLQILKERYQNDKD